MTEILQTPAVQRVLYVVGGILLGFLTEKVVVTWMHRIARRTEFEWDDVVADAIHWVPTVWFMAGGAYLAAQTEGVSELARQGTGTLVTVALIGSIVVGLMRAAGGLVDKISRKGDNALPAASLVSNLVRLAIGLIGVLLIFINLDIDITPILTVGGLGGLAVALALQEPLSNLFAGAQIIASGQVRPHDYVRLSSGEEGYVTDVKGRNTTIRTFPDGNLVVVPNATLASSTVKNFSLPQKSLWVSVSVGVSYDSDLEEVERVTMDVARTVISQVEGGIPDREPVLRYESFADSSINFTIRLFVGEFTDQFRIRHEFIKQLHARYGEAGIEIPFPIRTLHMSPPPEA